MDKVDILMATYNGEKFLKIQLESILSQKYTNWHLYISDDLSTDNSASIIKEYASKDSRITIVPAKKFGNAKDNFFYLLNFSTANYIMFCDQDDLWLPNKISNALTNIQLIEEDNKTIPLLVYSDLEVVDEHMDTIDNSYFHYQNIRPTKKFSKLLIQNSVTGCTMIFNKVLKEMTLQCKQTEYIIMHDWWMALISSCFGRVNVLSENSIKYRQHANNSVGAKNTRSFLYILKKCIKISNIRKDVIRTQLQAKCFYDNFYNSSSLNDHSKKCLYFSRDYGRCANLSKIARLKFYLNNNIRKNSIIKTIGLYLGG